MAPKSIVKDKKALVAIIALVSIVVVSVTTVIIIKKFREDKDKTIETAGTAGSHPGNSGSGREVVQSDKRTTTTTSSTKVPEGLSNQNNKQDVNTSGSKGTGQSQEEPLSKKSSDNRADPLRAPESPGNEKPMTKEAAKESLESEGNSIPQPTQSNAATTLDPLLSCKSSGSSKGQVQTAKPSESTEGDDTSSQQPKADDDNKKPNEQSTESNELGKTSSSEETKPKAPKVTVITPKNKTPKAEENPPPASPEEVKFNKSTRTVIGSKKKPLQSEEQAPTTSEIPPKSSTTPPNTKPKEDFTKEEETPLKSTTTPNTKPNEDPTKAKAKTLKSATKVEEVKEVDYQTAFDACIAKYEKRQTPLQEEFLALDNALAKVNAPQAGEKPGIAVLYKHYFEQLKQGMLMLNKDADRVEKIFDIMKRINRGLVIADFGEALLDNTADYKLDAFVRRNILKDSSRSESDFKEALLKILDMGKFKVYKFDKGSRESLGLMAEMNDRENLRKFFNDFYAQTKQPFFESFAEYAVAQASYIDNSFASDQERIEAYARLKTLRNNMISVDNTFGTKYQLPPKDMVLPPTCQELHSDFLNELGTYLEDDDGKGKARRAFDKAAKACKLVLSFKVQDCNGKKVSYAKFYERNFTRFVEQLIMTVIEEYNLIESNNERDDYVCVYGPISEDVKDKVNAKAEQLRKRAERLKKD